MSIYNEKVVATTPEEIKKDRYDELHNQLGTQVDFDDSIIYLNEEITEHTLFELIIRTRNLLKVRKDKQVPINLMINSPGGDIFEMFGIIDYINSLEVKVNTICRGVANSAAAIILACGTGSRMMSKHSSVMFHQSSSFSGGKVGDVSAHLDKCKDNEELIYTLLATKTKKDKEWWKENMRSDLYLTAEQLIEYGVIDNIV